MKLVLALIAVVFTTSTVQAQFWRVEASGFSNTSRGVNKIHIGTATTAWGVAYDGITPSNNIQEFVRTNDAGQSWIPGSFDLGNVNLGISNVCDAGGTTAYVAAHPLNAGDQGGVWKTTDAGLTWTRQAGALYQDSSSFPNFVHFFDNAGVTAGDPVNGFWEIYVSSNGGSTYTRVPSANIPAVLPGEFGYFGQYTYYGNNIWFTTSKGRIIHSSDRGVNWTAYQSPLSDFGGTTVFGDISFADSNKGIIQDNNGNLYRTNDSGATWQGINISGTGFPYGDFIAYVPDSNRIVSCGQRTTYSGSSYSLDDGVTWINIDTNQHLDVAFFNEDTGYSGGFNISSTVDGMFVYDSNVLNLAEEEQASLTMFPNPATDIIRFTTATSFDVIMIYDLNGRVVKQEFNVEEISISDLKTGTYLLTIESKEALNGGKTVNSTSYKTFKLVKI